jgi:pyruvate dehydrogenase E2 component (dihydrolipoamide acetyltransferase)
MRKAIAEAMLRSHRDIPQFHLTTTMDMSAAVTWLTRKNETLSLEERLVTGVLFLKGVALALRDFPELNGRWEDGRAVQAPDIHVGVAISLRRGGLVAPAIHNTDRLGLTGLMSAFRGLVQRARAGTLDRREMADPTITVTSLGDQGAEAMFGLIAPPQVALVGFGSVSERPWVVPGGVVARPLVTVTLTADHRVLDGHRGSLFLKRLNQLLQEPEKL